MRIQPFKLERYFAKYEFSTKYLLSSSDCEAFTQQEILNWADPETQRLWDNLKLSYTESRGLPSLREEIANLYCGVSCDEVLVIVPEEGIFITMNSLLDKGDHVICMFPGYQSLYEIAVSLGCEITFWSPNEENQWYFNPNFLVDNIQNNTKLVICNFPHNPTGYLPSKEDFKQIVKIVADYDLFFFSDEMYRFLEVNPDHRLPSAVELYDKSISLFGMSKTFGMPGVRLGWLITKDYDLNDRLALFKDYTTICNSAPSELLSLIALRAKDRIINIQMDRLKRNLALLERFLDNHSDLLRWVRPKAGSVCFPRLLINESSFIFCEKLIKDAGIMVLPSSVYNFGDRHIRIGFGRENFAEVLSHFDRYLNVNYI